MRVIETSAPVGCKGHEIPLAERMVQRPSHIVGQAFRTHLVIDGVLAAQRGIAFEILAYLGGTVMDFVGGTIDVRGSFPDIVVDSRNLGFAHPVGPHNPGAKPLRMVDQNMKRRPLDGNARSLEPDTQFCENIVNEALIARVVCKPVHNVTFRMRGDGIDFWRRVHILLLSSDPDRWYRICRVPARRRQWSPPQSACAHRVFAGLPRAAESPHPKHPCLSYRILVAAVSSRSSRRLPRMLPAQLMRPSIADSARFSRKRHD